MSGSPIGVYAGETYRQFSMIAKATGDPITGGTVSYLLKAITGDNAGKWYRASDDTWQVLPDDAMNAMEHQANGSWTVTLGTSPFAAGIIYHEHAVESTDAHVAGAARLLRCVNQPTVDASGKASSKYDWSADVTNKPTIGTSTLTTSDIDARLAAWGKTGFALDGATGWGGSALPTSFTASNMPSFPANFAALGINASGHVQRVVLVDTCTTNTDMRGTDGAYTGTPPSAATISTQVASDLATAHGAGSWGTATGFATSEQATAIKAVTDKLDTALVLDGAVYQFTANALELAPSSSGGDATAAKQDQIIAALGVVVGLVDGISAVTTKLDTTMRLDGAVYQFTTNALELAPSGDTAVTVLPLTSELTAAGRVPYWILQAYQHCKWTATLAIFDRDNNPVDLSAKTLSLVAWLPNTPTTAVFELRTDDASPEIAVGGVNGNQVSINALDTRTATALTLKWRLYNTTDDLAVADGEVRVEAGPSAT
jgi:hypothetical protein